MTTKIALFALALAALFGCSQGGDDPPAPAAPAAPTTRLVYFTVWNTSHSGWPAGGAYLIPMGSTTTFAIKPQAGWVPQWETRGLYVWDCTDQWYQVRPNPDWEGASTIEVTWMPLNAN